MSVEFLSAEQVAAFGRFTGAPSQAELDRVCVLSDTDMARVLLRRRWHNRLGFALQLVTVRMIGRFLPDPLQVPWEIVVELADQLGIEDASCVKAYAERLPTQHEHAREITAAYGYRKFDDPDVEREFRAFVAGAVVDDERGPAQAVRTLGGMAAATQGVAAGRAHPRQTRRPDPRAADDPTLLHGGGAGL